MKKIKNVLAHFKKVDPLLYSYALKLELQEIKPSENIFNDLCDSIVSQQLSGKAAATIFNRFKELFKDGVITAEKILKLKDEEIRKAGCSWAKVRSLKDLSEKVFSGKLDLNSLTSLTEKEIIEKLTIVKGIGPWTAEMFLMFTLSREDVFSHGDLGLKKAIKKIYQLENPTLEEIEKIVAKWSPYKTYASHILWKSLE